MTASKMQASKQSRERVRMHRAYFALDLNEEQARRVALMLDDALKKGAEDVRLVAVAHLRSIGEAATALGHIAIPGMVERAIAEVRAEEDKLTESTVKGRH